MSEATHTPGVIGLRLFLICAAAALMLGIVNEITEPRIAAQKISDRDQVIASFVDKGKVGEPVAGSGAVEAYYPVVDGDKPLGYVLSLTGRGYGGELKLLAYYAVDGAIRVAKLVDNQETPGLGKKAETAQYMGMFKGTGGGRPVPVSKEMLGAGQGGTGVSRPGEGQRVAWIRASRAGVGGWLFGAGAGGGGSAADSVTGATITFKGVSGALAEGSQFVKSLGGRK